MFKTLDGGIRAEDEDGRSGQVRGEREGSQRGRRGKERRERGRGEDEGGVRRLAAVGGSPAPAPAPARRPLPRGAGGLTSWGRLWYRGSRRLSTEVFVWLYVTSTD